MAEQQKNRQLFCLELYALHPDPVINHYSCSRSVSSEIRTLFFPLLLHFKLYEFCVRKFRSFMKVVTVTFTFSLNMPAFYVMQEACKWRQRNVVSFCITFMHLWYWKWYYCRFLSSVKLWLFATFFVKFNIMIFLNKAKDY